jgi:hypothetical protein
LLVRADEEDVWSGQGMDPDDWNEVTALFERQENEIYGVNIQGESDAISATPDIL